MEGIVVSATAEKISTRIEKLIFVGAFVPSNGQSILQLAQTDAISLFGPTLIPSADQLTLDMKLSDLAPVFVLMERQLKNFYDSVSSMAWPIC